jgi:hypothetical protein
MDAPLDRYSTSEMMRCFAHCYGVEAFVGLLASDSYFEPLRISDLEGARYHGGIQSRFPELDDAERAWVEDFNARARERWDSSRWPGTKSEVVVR